MHGRRERQSPSQAAYEHRCMRVRGRAQTAACGSHRRMRSIRQRRRFDRWSSAGSSFATLASRAWKRSCGSAFVYRDCQVRHSSLMRRAVPRKTSGSEPHSVTRPKPSHQLPARVHAYGRYMLARASVSWHDCAFNQLWVQDLRRRLPAFVNIYRSCSC